MQIFYTTQFTRDLSKLKKQQKDLSKIKEVIDKIIACEVLPIRYRDHKLNGKFKDRKECHIEPDWLLIYKKNLLQIIFERTGSHSDLFK